MRTDKTSTQTRNDFASACENITESTLNTMKAWDAQRQEVEKMTRETLERTGSLMKVWWQTGMDLFDMSTRNAATWQRLGEEAFRSACGVARKAVENATPCA